MIGMLRMVVVLSVLCGLSGFALSYLKMVTAPRIEEQVLTYVQGPALARVFTHTQNSPIADRRNRGIGGDTLAGIGITTLKETPGLGMRVTEQAFSGQFAGARTPVALASQGGSIDGVSGATISSGGVVTAVNKAVQVYSRLKPEILKVWSK